MSRPPFLRRLRLRNFKSIADCDVELNHLTLLVGRNGSGKSNFMDALAFTADALRSSLDHAIRSRGGIDEVRRRSTGHPHNFSVRLEFGLADGRAATYEYEIAARRNSFSVKRERLSIVRLNGTPFGFVAEQGEVTSNAGVPVPPASTDRLYLVNAAGLPEFREPYDLLSSMGFYSLNPERMRDLQVPDEGDLLTRDGGNLAGVVARLAREDPRTRERVEQFLFSVVPGITAVEPANLGPKETLLFKQAVKGSKHPWSFYAAAMSDGTLRVLGILIATMQRHVPLVGVEEPETALHPAAAGELMGALREASVNTQVLVTTHSPELLDQVNFETDRILVVQEESGTTLVGPIDEVGRSAVRDHLYTAGDLLRMDQLTAAPSSPTQKRFALGHPDRREAAE